MWNFPTCIIWIPLGYSGGWREQFLTNNFGVFFWVCRNLYFPEFGYLMLFDACCFALLRIHLLNLGHTFLSRRKRHDQRTRQKLKKRECWLFCCWQGPSSEEGLSEQFWWAVPGGFNLCRAAWTCSATAYSPACLCVSLCFADAEQPLALWQFTCQYNPDRYVKNIEYCNCLVCLDRKQLDCGFSAPLKEAFECGDCWIIRKHWITWFRPWHSENLFGFLNEIWRWWTCTKWDAHPNTLIDLIA